jgi:HEAT repeat protein
VLGFFGRLTVVDAELAARVLRFLIDGSDDEVLLSLGGVPRAAEVLGLSGATTVANWELVQHLAQRRAELFMKGASGQPAYCLRLAQVLETLARTVGATHPIQPLGWPNWLVRLVLELVSAWTLGTRLTGGKPKWTASDLEAVLAVAGLPKDLLARSALDLHLGGHVSYGMYYSNQLASALSNWPSYLERHLVAVREILSRPDAETRLQALQFLGNVRYDFTPVVDLLVEIGTGSAKTPREAALPFLRDRRDAARALVERILAEGDAGQRHEAAQLLWRLDDRAAADTLRRHAEHESSERIRQTIDKLLAVPDETGAEANLAASLPPLEMELGPSELPAEFRTTLRDWFDAALQQARQMYERQLEQWNQPNRPKWCHEPVEPEPVTAKDLDELVRYLEGKEPGVPPRVHSLSGFVRQTGIGEQLPSGLSLAHLRRLDQALGYLRIDVNGSHFWWNTLNLEAYRGRCARPFGLREMDAVIAATPEGRPGLVARAYLSNNSSYQSFCDWEPEAVWPVFAEYPDILRQVLAPEGTSTRHDYSLPLRRRNAFRVLAMFPQLPAGFVPLLWDLALGESKSERPDAQAALARVPDKAAKILVALQDGRQAIRAAAAEWLGKLGDAAAIEPLKTAFRKEKVEAVKGTMLVAVESLGGDVSEFLNRPALLSEAETGLAKKRPKGMEWLPIDRLPVLHWQDSGESVDPRVVQWWLVQCIQQKSPVPGPLLRRYLAMCRPHEATALAKFVLTTWMGRDTRTVSTEAAAERAQREADQQWAYISQHPQMHDYYKGNKDTLFNQLFAHYSSEFLGSAIDQKGMLALAAAAGDAECVKLCEQYIRKWFGNRLAQCKALVEVLAWTQHPLAIQVLLSLANRFRTKAVRQAAEEHVQALADREGWTIDELADRTIPDAGFERPTDADGKPIGDRAALVLDYGSRTFTVGLDDELQPVITTEEGKTVKSPPAPGKNDDAEKAKAAKKAFSDAKKTVKEVVKRQTERFYEALCTQRSWRFEDWKRYLADHSIVSRLCVQLAWAAFASQAEGERFLGCFRPLEDGSLTNEKDDQVKFDPDTRVRLAHTANTPAELGQAWAQHFEDYDLSPPFQQFGRPTYELPQDKKNETDLKDFQGHMLTVFKLRGRATKLGYVRGEAEDGGWFHLYRKPFSSLSVQAVIEFTGSSLPEQDRPAALTQLYFLPLKGDRETVYSFATSKLPLSKVPPVLLSECYNDLKQLAAEGSGFDPEWQKHSGY